MNYKEFLDNKSQLGGNHGFDPTWIPDFLFDFQKHIVNWAVKKGRAAIFADCGLGKTPMQLVWAENIIRKTGKNVLILTPLAVSSQTLREANKFDIPATISHDGKSAKGITITNYEKLHYFNSSDFIGVVCDESSILKSFSGVRRKEITAFMRKLPYRLLLTATAAPNDYMELGTSSEALGYLNYTDMLARFFKNEQNTSVAALQRKHGEIVKWRLKGHAVIPFWRWISSWAIAMRMPSDLGFSDNNFVLPPLIEKEHIVTCNIPPDGWLFNVPALGLYEEREERRRTLKDRCELISDMVNKSREPFLVWCHLNDEGDLLEKLIPDSLQVKGSQSEELKGKRLLDFADGNLRVLVTKPKIGAWGMNFQNCANITIFPSHSFEQYYQGIRRCYRFGQKKTVRVDIITTEGERSILKNMQRKIKQANDMFISLIAEMNNAMTVNISHRDGKKEEIPSWLLISN